MHIMCYRMDMHKNICDVMELKNRPQKNNQY